MAFWFVNEEKPEDRNWYFGREDAPKSGPISGPISGLNLAELYKMGLMDDEHLYHENHRHVDGKQIKDVPGLSDWLEIIWNAEHGDERKIDDSDSELGKGSNQKVYRIKSPKTRTSKVILSTKSLETDLDMKIDVSSGSAPQKEIIDKDLDKSAARFKGLEITLNDIVNFRGTASSSDSSDVKVRPDQFNKWSANQVAKWLQSFDSGKYKIYAERFLINEVDGALLADLTRGEMKTFFKEDLDIKKAGIRMKLLIAFQRLITDCKVLEDHKEEVPPNIDELMTSFRGYMKEKRIFTLGNAARKDDDCGKGLLEGWRLLYGMRSKIEPMKGNMEIKHDAFLSHAQKNSADLCRSIKRRLQDFKISAWYDMQAKRLDAIGMAEAVVQAKVFVLVATVDYFSRPWCLFELLLAEIFQKPIILLMETVKDHGGFENFQQLMSKIPEGFSYLLEYEVCEVKRRGLFWDACVIELCKRIKPTQMEEILSVNQEDVKLN